MTTMVPGQIWEGTLGKEGRLSELFTGIFYSSFLVFDRLVSEQRTTLTD